MRVVCIVLDGCGAGAAPDAAAFGDVGINEGHTLLNVWKAVGGIKAPNLKRLGYFAAAGIEHDQVIEANYGRLREVSIGKDTVTGHWEMMGIHLERPFPTYPKGFPIPLIKDFERRIGLQTIGNEAASGTEIIERLGLTHVETGCPIIYTSADSVFQIACHEEVIPVAKLYEICETAREILVDPDDVGRVIARPFLGSEAQGFSRTVNRRDFPLPPPPNMADKIAEATGLIFGIGVIPEVFSGRGFRAVRRTQENAEHGAMLLAALSSDARFIWANFEDFDMLYGHRNDPLGFANSLEKFDVFLGDLMSRLGDDDLLILTADHGNDPTTPSTDHSREYVPVSIWSSGASEAKNLGDMEGLWYIGEMVSQALGVPA
ncbi:MAG: phosphopentomutase [Fimbriimonadales bacterium]